MNTQTYRVIFNKSRGCLMAIGENARSSGAGCSGVRRTTRQWSRTDEDCNWWGKCTTTVTQGLEDKTSQTASVIKGGNAVEVAAGKDLTTYASTIEGGDVSLSPEGKIKYLAAQNINRNEVHSETSSSWFGIDTSWGGFFGGKSESTDITVQTKAAVSKLQSEADILSQSGGDTLLQGTQVKAQNFTVNAGVGPSANSEAKIIIEGVKETLQTSHTEKSESLVWQAQSGNGVTEETLKLAQINAKSKFSAPGGIDVQLPAGDPLKQQIQTLSQQPGMEWLSDLSQRKDVNWQEIKLAKDSWSYDQQGLTQAGAIILTIAVMVATGGMGAGVTTTTTTLAGTTLATSTAGAAASYTAAGAALNAGFSALAVQASISLANNGGDISKTLKDMGSSTTVRNTLVAMATAGVGTAVAGQGASAVAAQTVAGCASGAVTGAGCEKGATTAAVLSTAGETYQSLVGYAANAGPGENRNGFGKTDQTYTPDYPHFYVDPGGRTAKIIEAQKTYCQISGGCK